MKSMKNYMSISLMILVVFCFLTACGGNAKNDTGIKKYTVDYVLERCDLAGYGEFSEDGNTWYYQKIDQDDRTEIIIMKNDNEYSGYHFYIFKSESKAKKELERRKKSFFEEDEFEMGSNYVGGWEADVMDESIKLYDYQSLNLIVEVRDEDIPAEAGGVDGWYEEYYSEEATAIRRETSEKIHEKIKREW